MCNSGCLNSTSLFTEKREKVECMQFCGLSFQHLLLTGLDLHYILFPLAFTKAYSIFILADAFCLTMLPLQLPLSLLLLPLVLYTNDPVEENITFCLSFPIHTIKIINEIKKMRMVYITWSRREKKCRTINSTKSVCICCACWMQMWEKPDMKITHFMLRFFLHSLQFSYFLQWKLHSTNTKSKIINLCKGQENNDRKRR